MLSKTVKNLLSDDGALNVNIGKMVKDSKKMFNGLQLNLSNVTKGSQLGPHYKAGLLKTHMHKHASKVNPFCSNT